MKIAVFIAGPYRFSHLVLESLDRVLGNIDYDVFFHLWKEDFGNKKRVEEDKNYEKLMSYPKTKLFLLANPYTESMYEKDIGTNTNSNSSINAIMGMFMSMNVLSNYLELLPDKNDYTHILRLRTDCIIFNNIENIIKKYQNNILVSNNFGVPCSWISDHIMIAPKDKFYLFWKFKGMNDIYKAYSNGKRNPEKTLQYLGRRYRQNILKLFNRGLDYHIIYNPPKETDTLCVKQSLEDKGVNYLFSNITDIVKIIDKEKEYKILNKKQKMLSDPYSIKSKIKLKIKRLIGLK